MEQRLSAFLGRVMKSITWHKPPARKRRPTCRLTLEALEPRIALANWLYWDPGVGDTTGTETAAQKLDFSDSRNWATYNATTNIFSAAGVVPTKNNAIGFYGNVSNGDCHLYTTLNTVTGLRLANGYTGTFFIDGANGLGPVPLYVNGDGGFYMSAGTIVLQNGSELLLDSGAAQASFWRGGTITDPMKAGTAAVVVEQESTLYILCDIGTTTLNNANLTIGATNDGTVIMGNSTALVESGTFGGLISVGALSSLKFDVGTVNVWGTNVAYNGYGGIASTSTSTNAYISVSGMGLLSVNGDVNYSPDVQIPLLLKANASATIGTGTLGDWTTGGIAFGGGGVATSNASVDISGNVGLYGDPNFLGVGLTVTNGLIIETGGAFYTQGSGPVHVNGNFKILAGTGTLSIGQDLAGGTVDLHVSGSFTQTGGFIYMTLLGSGGSDVLECGGDITLNGTVQFNLSGAVQQHNGMWPYWVPIYTDDGNPITHTGFNPVWPNNDTHYSADWSTAGNLKVIYNGG
jgi:hypothetical protein